MMRHWLQHGKIPGPRGSGIFCFEPEERAGREEQKNLPSFPIFLFKKNLLVLPVARE